MKIGKRWIYFFLILPVLFFSSLAFYFLGTEIGFRSLVNYALPLLKTGDLEVKISEIFLKSPGNFVLEGVSGHSESNRATFFISKIHVDVALLSFLSSQPLFHNLDCDEIKIEGRINLPWLDAIPKPPPFGCSLIQSFQPKFEYVKVKKLSWRSESGASMAFTLENFELQSGEKTKNSPHPIAFIGKLEFKGSELLNGSFSGGLHFSPPSIEGVFEGKIFGKNLKTDLKWMTSPGTTSINGHLKPLSLDAEFFSKWLGELWQRDIPIAFSGGGIVEGSWMVDSRVGLSGNMKGEINQLKIKSIGFLIDLFEINNDLLFSLGKLKFSDRGSLFMGFPCSFSGEIGIDFPNPPDWNLGLIVPKANLGEIIASLPWALKYGLGVPNLTGMAGLTISATGFGPSIKGKLFSAMLHLHSPEGVATFSGKLDYRKSPLESPEYRLQTTWVTETLIPYFLEKIILESKPLSEKFSPPVKFSGDFIGSSMQNLVISGKLFGNQEIFQLIGTWKDGMWTEFRLNGNATAPGHLDLGSLSPPDLLLLSGK